jgi:pyruvate formate lyase activating enzyme
MHELGIWVEVTTLIVPGENDSEKELRGIAGFLSGIDKDMPWHISKFHPDYKFTEYPDTSEETLKRAVGYGRDAGLSYVYAGNVCGWGNDTYCASCKRLVIKREGFGVTGYDIKNGLCSFCNARISGLFQ